MLLFLRPGKKVKMRFNPVFIIVLGLLFFQCETFANVQTRPAQTASQYTSFDNCYKMFTADCEKLFLLTLSSISANNYKIVEMQSKSGHVVFLAENKEFLAAVSRVDAKSAMLKITPVGNSYAFSPAIPEKVFKNIVENINKPF